MTLTKDNSKDSLHRLEDILVEEVSLVDRAANKRKFLVVKRSGEMGTELTPDGNGGFAAADDAADVAKAKAVADKAKADADAEKAKADADAAAEKVKADATKAKGKKADDEEASKAKATPAKMEEEDDAPAGKKPPFLGKVNDARKALFDLVVDNDIDADALTSAIKAIGEALEQPEVDTVEKADVSTLIVEVEKAGARMSKDRFKRFKQGIELLMSVFGELSPSDMAPPEPPAAKGKKAKAQKSASSEDSFDAEEAITKLTDSVASIAAAVHVNKSAMTDIATSRGAGNAIPVEKSAAQIGSADNVSWPLDLNTDVRERVGKSNIFD